MNSKSKSKKSKTKKKPQGISFTSFFNDCVRRGALKTTQKAEISLFFKESGLKDKEDLKIYNETLKKY